MQPAIRVENLGKSYRLNHTACGKGSYKTIRETLTGLATAPARRLRSAFSSNSQLLTSNSSSEEEFWALKDVSFEVQPGEVVGIIGRNGAGKSTLLKILSRITKPTTGQVKLRGRVGSLLEVGTGFHPELTGRENIYLNGSILGMARSQITRRFDEIVAFAEVEKFLDTPVKRYSSGMYVRLAFAVAAHLEPEILIIDEVLAVGDAEFQKRCLGKMGEVASHGRTVLFVSHNMAAVTRLCKRVIMLGEGQLIDDGSAEAVAKMYLRSGLGTSAAREWTKGNEPGDKVTRLLAVRVRAESGEVLEAADIRRRVGVEMEYDVLEEGHELVPNLHFFNEDGVYLFITIERDPAWHRRPRPIGRYVSTAWIPGNLLAEGTLVVGAAVTTLAGMKIHFYERDAIAFQVVDSTDGGSARGDYAGPMPGAFRPLLEWNTALA